jgi:hypothetical protein
MNQERRKNKKLKKIYREREKNLKETEKKNKNKK